MHPHIRRLGGAYFGGCRGGIPEHRIAVRDQIIGLARHRIPVEIDAAELGGIETVECPVARHIGHEVDRRLIALPARGAGRLTDIFVVKHNLRPPNVVGIEIMFPAQPQDLARIVAAGPGFIAGLRDRGASETIEEEIDGAASIRFGGKEKLGKA